MARGANTEEILYGETPERGKRIRPVIKTLPDGTREHYNERAQLSMLELPKDVEKTVGSNPIKGECVAYMFLGELHRDDGPALVTAEGGEYWLKHGVKHRDGGPAVVEPGLQVWIRDGKLHREDGPAVVWDEREMWYFEGEPHREDGPAIKTEFGHIEWWRHGQKYFSEKEHRQAA